MNGKRVAVFIVCIILTAGLVIAGVFTMRLKEAVENPVSVFFGDEVVIPDGEQEDNTPVIREVDLVRDGKSYVKKDNILNIVLLGRDATPKRYMGYSVNGVNVYDARSDGGNTDVMIVMAIDVETGDVQAISIPRDTIAHIYHYYDTEDTINKEYFHKLNGAYGAGPRDLDEVQIRNSVTCIQEHLNTFGTFDIQINNYVEVSLVGLLVLTEEVGGVEVTLANGIPGVGSAGQTVTLNGITAMTFIRDRKNSGGDLGRVSNSQIYIRALAKKLQSMGATEIAPTLAKTMIGKNVMRTDLNAEQIAALAGVLQKIDVYGVQMHTVGTIEKSGIYGFKDYLKTYDYNYEAFYGADKWKSLDIREGEGGDFGFFTDYENLEEIMLQVYYEEVTFE